MAGFFCHDICFGCHARVFGPLGASLGAISMDYGPFSPDTSYTLLVRARVRVRIVESSVFLPCFPWHACSSVHDGRRERFFTCPRTARSGYVYWSVYGSWNRMCFCPVFHGTRAAPSTTGVGNFFSLVPVRPVLGTCTGPCTDRGIEIGRASCGERV